MGLKPLVPHGAMLTKSREELRGAQGLLRWEAGEADKGPAGRAQQAMRRVWVLFCRWYGTTKEFSK